MIRKLVELYQEKEYESFLKLFDEYLSEGYGVDMYIITLYINSLLALKYFDEVYKITKYLEEKKYISDTELKRIYLRCYKPKEVVKIDTNKEDVMNLFYTIAAYMAMGKVDDAKSLVEDAEKLEDGYKVSNFSKKIFNFEHRNAAIEIEYDSFIENGNELEKGHIIYLKRTPDFSYYTRKDKKAFNRPYMIWKIEGEKLYLFPLTSKCKDNSYKLYSQKYPNSDYDRGIKPNTCVTMKNNVLSVADKVLDEDYASLVSNIYYGIYFATINGNSEFRCANREFIKDYIKEVEQYDVLEFINNDEREFYFVLECFQHKYSAIEIDFRNGKIIGADKTTIRKDRLIYKLFKISEEEKNIFKRQLYDFKYGNKSFKGKIVTIDNINFIVLNEKDDYCFCVNSIYSSSYMDTMLVHKERIKRVVGEVDDDTLENINTMLSHNNTNVVSQLKRICKKKLSRY